MGRKRRTVRMPWTRANDVSSHLDLAWSYKSLHVDGVSKAALAGVREPRAARSRGQTRIKRCQGASERTIEGALGF